MAMLTQREVASLADQVESVVTMGTGFRTQQESLLGEIEGHITVLKTESPPPREVIASLMGLRVQLRSVLGLSRLQAVAHS